jgi:hypothetical protein
MIFLLFFLTVLAIDNDFALLGLDTNFSSIPDTFHVCNYSDYSCHKIICQMLDDPSCISYVAVVPRTEEPICTQKLLPRSANMVVFGMDVKKQTKISAVCDTISKCLMIGCQMYSTDIVWVLYTGSCQKIEI